jgi:hypothetical protein
VVDVAVVVLDTAQKPCVRYYELGTLSVSTSRRFPSKRIAAGGAQDVAKIDEHLETITMAIHIQHRNDSHISTSAINDAVFHQLPSSLDE